MIADGILTVLANFELITDAQQEQVKNVADTEVISIFEALYKTLPDVTS